MKNETNFKHYLDMITRNDSVSFQILEKHLVTVHGVN